MISYVFLKDLYVVALIFIRYWVAHIESPISQVLTKGPTFDLALGWSDAEAYIEVIKSLITFTLWNWH